MKIKIKKSIALLLILFLGLSVLTMFAGCGGDSSGSDNNKNDGDNDNKGGGANVELSGKYILVNSDGTYDETNAYEFLDDGKCTVFTYGVTTEFTFEVNENNLTIKMDYGSFKGTIETGGNKITLNEYGENIVYEKKSESNDEAQLSDSGELTIVGTWTDNVYGFEYTYNADGTMNMFDVTKNYTFEDGILTQYGDAFDTVFDVVFENSNTIVLTQTDPYPLVPVTYTRKR